MKGALSRVQAENLGENNGFRLQITLGAIRDRQREITACVLRPVLVAHL